MTTIYIAREDSPLIPSVSIQNLLEQRSALLERVDQAIELLTEAYEISRQSGLGFPDVIVDDHRGTRGIRLAGDLSKPTKARKTIESIVDAAGWRYLVDASGLKSVMSASKRKEFDTQIANESMPALTMEAVIETFRTLHESRAQMFDAGVIECFRSLSWDYKTNNPVQFGKRIIMSNVIERFYFVERAATNHLDDLMRVFHVFGLCRK